MEYIKDQTINIVKDLITKQTVKQKLKVNQQ